jgi:hypothetical protein
VPHKRGRQRAASSERRRKAGCGGVGEFAAGVFQFPRGKRQGDDRLAANPTADSRGGDDDAQWRTASGGGGARPANPIGCYEAQEHAQSAPGCSSPPRATAGILHDGGRATDGYFQAAAELGFCAVAVKLGD